MASDVIVRQHIDDLLTTSTLAGAQSTLGIQPYVSAVVQTNSGAWGEVNQAALNLKANRNNATLTGLLSATGPVIINVSSSTNALRVTQTGTGNALIVEDDMSPDSTPFVITSGGDVGIGKVPTAKLEVIGSGDITRFNGTTPESNGISINNNLASANTYKAGYVNFRNENNITVSNATGTVETNGSSDLIFSTTPSGVRNTDRLAVRLVVKGSGNVGIGTSSPSAKLHVSGDIRCDGSITSTGTLNAGSLQLTDRNGTLIIPTSSRVQFGGSSENTDPIYIQRVNTGEYFGGRSELRIILGDDSQANGVFSVLSSTYVDSIVVGGGGYLGWMPKIVLDSHGLISCFGDYNQTTTNPLTGSPAMPVSAAHLTTKHYVDQYRTPPGAIMTFAMSAAPTGWLYCNGQQVNRTTYAALFSAIGTTYGAGNNTTTFTLPDLRGEFIRGWDDGRNIDAGRAFASTQKGTITVADPNLNTLSIASIYSQYELNTVTFAPVAGYDIININDYAGVYRAHQTSSGFSALGSGELAQGATRPRNIALYYCIKT